MPLRGTDDKAFLRLNISILVVRDVTNTSADEIIFDSGQCRRRQIQAPAPPPSLSAADEKRLSLRRKTQKAYLYAWPPAPPAMMALTFSAISGQLRARDAGVAAPMNCRFASMPRAK